MQNTLLFNILKTVNFIDRHYFKYYLVDISKNAIILNNKTKRKLSMNSYAHSKYFFINRRMGEYVKFGEDVVFRHVDSLDYLSGSVRCSDGGLGAFRV